MATALGFPTEDLKELDIAELKELVGAARCPRCGGLLVTEWCFDLLDDSGHLDIPVHRCVQCGERVDPVILRNRRLRLLSGLEKIERGLKSSVC